MNVLLECREIAKARKMQEIETQMNGEGTKVVSQHGSHDECLKGVY